MKSHMFLRTFGAVVAAAAISTPALAQSPDTGHRSGRYTVVFRSSTLPADAAARVSAAGGKVQQRVSDIGVLTASGDAAFAALLAGDSSVLSVGPEKFYMTATLGCPSEAITVRLLGRGFWGPVIVLARLPNRAALRHDLALAASDWSSGAGDETVSPARTRRTSAARLAGSGA